MKKDDSLGRIPETFRGLSAPHRLSLPRRVMTSRSAGAIAKKGWLIQYLFGKDEKGEYLDVYTSHRHPGENHVRLRPDGSIEQLEVLGSIYFCSDDPAEQKKLEEDFYRKNREIARRLVEKGFTRFSLNMALEADLIEEHLPLPDEVEKQ